MTKTAIFASAICVALSGLIGVTNAFGQSGRDYAVKSQNTTFGYETLTATAKMTLYRGDKAVGTRVLEVSQIEQEPGSHDLALVEIKSPTSLEGTRLLSWSDDKGDDQQWLTTGNTNRARRIGDRGRKASFVNSDFTFEDLLKWQVDAYTYEKIGQASCPAGTCTQVRAIPSSRASVYGALLIDYDSKNRISRIQYFRKPDGPVWKELIASKYENVGNSEQPSLSVMTDFSANTHTRIDWSNYQANAKIDSSIFTPK